MCEENSENQNNPDMCRRLMCNFFVHLWNAREGRRVGANWMFVVAGSDGDERRFVFAFSMWEDDAYLEVQKKIKGSDQVKGWIRLNRTSAVKVKN